MTKRASKAAQKAVKGTPTKTRRVRNSLRFRRPSTRLRSNAPQLDRRAIPRVARLNTHNVLLAPISNASVLPLIESDNTIIFYVDKAATKRVIKDTIYSLFKVRVSKVRTLNTPTGKKKAFIRVGSDEDAMKIASKINLIV